MSRIFKIFVLILLVPLYWGIQTGCSGGLTGGGPLGGGFNGAAPGGGGGDGTPGGGDYRPSGQPTGGIIPMPAAGRFYISLKFNSASDSDAMQSQCSQFVASAYQDAKRRNLLYALNDAPPKINGTDGSLPPPPPPVCNHNNHIDLSTEQCDDNNNSCCVNCHFAAAGDKCQDPSGPAGKCTKNDVCVPPPMIRGTIVVYHGNSKYFPMDAVDVNYPRTNFEIDPCTLGNGKTIEFGYNGAYGCQASVELSAEITDPKTGEKTFITDHLQGNCPMGNGPQVCKVNLNLKQGNQPENKTIACEFVDTPQTTDLSLQENTTASPMQNAPPLEQ